MRKLEKLKSDFSQDELLTQNHLRMLVGGATSWSEGGKSGTDSCNGAGGTSFSDGLYSNMDTNTCGLVVKGGNIAS
jgi:hypothetical protein